MAGKASAVSGGTISRSSATTAAEVHGLAAVLGPVLDTAAEHGTGIDAGGREDARGGRRARAGRADRDHGALLGLEVVGERANEAVRHVPRTVDVALVALGFLAHVEHLDLAVGDQRLELVDVDRLERLARVGVGEIAA